MQAMTAFQVIGGLAKGLAGRAAGISEAARQDSEARLAETQGLQRDAASRDELTRFLSTTQSARAANGLGSLSPNALILMRDASKVSNSERMVQSANDRQRAANLRAGAAASRRGASLSLITGAAEGGIPLAQSFL